MNLPGFTAAATLYKTSGHYTMTNVPNSIAAQVVPQLSRLGVAPWPWCRDACELCTYYGLYCWPCFICAIYPSDVIANDFIT